METIRRIWKSLRRHVEDTTAALHGLANEGDASEAALLERLERLAAEEAKTLRQLREYDRRENVDHQYALRQLRQSNGLIEDMGNGMAEAKVAA